MLQNLLANYTKHAGKLQTPIGSYTPDGAVLEREGEQKLYFAHFATLEMSFECSA
ncbi:hypothetical protein [Bartonella sp. AU18XJBT]|uniref:hypothetical protein n=1 Tax=Bartonella sp. AU18XJBT TaxID=3019089 RepID=UPI00235F9352|nr:hypothetical protein [Bartonella sp. AU18XJBT]